MLFSFGLAFALLQTRKLAFAAGFYTLQELSDGLGKQGIIVSVAPTCAQDVYAIRMGDVSWDQLRAALGRDGRLEISETKHGWQVERSVTVKRDEGRERDAYLAFALSTTHSFFLSLSQKCAELELHTADERHAAVEEARSAAGSDQIKADYAQQLYLFSDEHDMGYYELTIPGALTDPGVGPGKVINTNIWDARFLVAPNGDISKFPLFDNSNGDLKTVADKARKVLVLLKLAWDPVTLQMGYRLRFYTEPIPPMDGRNGVVLFVPNRFRLAVPVESVLNKAAIDSVAKRATLSEAALKANDLTAEGTMPKRPIRVGEALLRSAESAKVNLVYFVSNLTDFRLNGADSLSIADIVSQVNSGATDPLALADAGGQRLGAQVNGSRPRLAFKLPSPLTATMDDGVCVVRNEVRFLDGLCDAPAMISTADANEVLRGRLPTLSAIVKEVAASPLRGGVSSDSIDFCNPVTFRPFAIAMSASPNLVKKVLEVKVNTVESFPFADLDPQARDAILAEVQRAAPFNDATLEVQYDPAILSQALNQFGGSDLALQVEAAAHMYVFTLLHGKERLWRSIVSNVDSR